MEKGIYLKEMGSKIKEARIAKKLSYPKFSVLTGIDMSNLWFIEQGRRNLHLLTLKAIADVLKMDVKDFL
jgi:transcriptional regulator with XRE-family HTH domain